MRLHSGLLFLAAGLLHVTSAQQLKLPPPSKALPATTNKPDLEHLTLEEVLKSVERHYPPLRAALLDVPVADAEYLAAQGRFDLAIRSIVDSNSLGFYESRRWDVAVEQPLQTMGATLFSGYQVSSGRFPSYDGKFQTDGLGEWRAGLRVPLLRDREIDGRRTELRKADIGRRIADLGVRQQQIVIIQLATNRYWNWVAAGRRFAVADAILNIAVDRETILEKAVELGQLPGFEVQDNKRIIEQRRAQRVMARRGLEAASFDLSLFFRDAQGQPLIPKLEQLPPAFPEPVPIDDRQLEADIETALRRRPEIARLENQQEQVRLDRRLAQNRRLPNIDFLLTFDRELGQRQVLRGPSELRAGIIFDLPLQRRTATGQAVAAQNRISQIDQRLTFLRDQITVEVRDAVSAVRAAYESAAATRQEVTYTRTVEDLERQRYDLGESNLFFLNTREIQTADAAVREVGALADYYRALALYELAIAKALGNVRP